VYVQAAVWFGSLIAGPSSRRPGFDCSTCGIFDGLTLEYYSSYYLRFFPTIVHPPVLRIYPHIIRGMHRSHCEKTRKVHCFRHTYTSKELSSRAVWGVCLGLLAAWDCGLEFRRGRGRFSLVILVCCAVRGLCDGPILHPG